MRSLSIAGRHTPVYVLNVGASPNLPGGRLLRTLRVRPSELAPDGPAVDSGTVPERRRARTLGGIALVALLVATISLLAARVGSETLMLSPAERGLMAAHGTWRHMFDYGAFSSRYPVLFWVVALVVVGLIGLPYAWLAGASLPDRGVTLARPIGQIGRAHV